MGVLAMIARRRAIAPLHRQWVAHTLLTPQHIVVPNPLLLTQHRLPDCHHQEGILALLHLTTKESLRLHPDTLSRIPGHASLPRIRRRLPALGARPNAAFGVRPNMSRPTQCVGKTRGFSVNPGSSFVDHVQLNADMGLGPVNPGDPH